MIKHTAINEIYLNEMTKLLVRKFNKLITRKYLLWFSLAHIDGIEVYD